MKKQTLLIELGTEELPPKALSKLSDAFNQQIIQGLAEAELIDSQDNFRSFATPRRLAISVANVLACQPDQTVERRGPSVQAAFDDDGNPSKAALGFAQSCGVEFEKLQRLKTDKGEWLSYTEQQSGKSLAGLIQAIIEQAIKRLPIPKRMRWGNGEAEFVRPVHWLIILHGKDIIDSEILGVTASNFTLGHRFHSDGEITIKNADDYADTLAKKGQVIADFAERQALIQQQITDIAKQLNGQITTDQALLDEVTGLVEKPFAIAGNFDDEFLSVPQECLISSMRDHQKYFHIKDDNNQLMAKFITISNIDSKTLERVREGNERVLRARLSDAQFFWQTDLKKPLESRLEQLDNVLFHIKLGSISDKSKRVEKLVGKIAKKINADSNICQQAAQLAKADLVSDMVGEFAELQGVMGHYYADNDGHNKLIGDCIEQHYWPKFAGDQLPASGEAQALALADKIDSLVGLYSIGETPTGDKDRYGLRRIALSILRILIEQELPLELNELVNASADIYQQQDIAIDQQTREQISVFVRERLITYYRNQQIAMTTFHAVNACASDSPLDFDYRIKAVHEFQQGAGTQDLAAANKRITNILKKQSVKADTKVDNKLLVEPAEQALSQALDNIEQECNHLFDQGDYSKGLQKLATLRGAVDDFFEHVMVMSQDEKQQQNRLALLSKLRRLFLRVADISLLQY